MKKFKGTQGKWQVNKGHDCYIIQNEDGVIVSECDINANYNTPLMPAPLYNAQLIASAPELLEALQDLVRYCQDNDNGAELELSINAINKAL